MGDSPFTWAILTRNSTPSLGRPSGQLLPLRRLHRLRDFYRLHRYAGHAGDAPGAVSDQTKGDIPDGCNATPHPKQEQLTLVLLDLGGPPRPGPQGSGVHSGLWLEAR